jgi:hypothetical protein
MPELIFPMILRGSGYCTISGMFTISPMMVVGYHFFLYFTARTIAAWR